MDRFAPLPRDCFWNTQDYTIVNSNGVANDPRGELCRYGGEINTRPTWTIEDQAGLATYIAATLGAVINYRCNLHVHVGVPGLKDDLVGLKRVARYIRANERIAMGLVEPIPEPDPALYSRDAFRGAMQRFRRRHRSHQTVLSEPRYIAMTHATTPLEFKAAMAGPHPALFQRPGINMASLWQQGTVEFRHFPGTVHYDEFLSALKWCALFMEAALSEHGLPSAWVIYSNNGPWKFPHFEPYNHDLELGWRHTNLGQPRHVVRGRIAQGEPI